MKVSKRTGLLIAIIGLFFVYYGVGVVFASREQSVQPLGFAVQEGQLAPAAQVLVKFKDGVKPAVTSQIKNNVGAGATIEKLGPKNHKDTYLFALKPGNTAKEAVTELQANPNVVAAEPNKLRKGFFLPNDPMLPEQWGLENFGQTIQGATGTPGNDINALPAWDFEWGNSSTSTVAVIDSGIDLNHPDLVNKIWTNPGEIPNNGIDDDHNGYVDDVNGYNFAGITMKGYNWVRPLGSVNAQVAQSIKGTGQSLDMVAFGIVKSGDPHFGVIVSVRDTLNGPSLATATILPDEVPVAPAGFQADDPANEQIVETAKTLSQSVRLAVDQTYYISLETTTSDSLNHYLLTDMSTAPGQDLYKEGMEHWKVGNTWMNVPNYDLTFRTNANASPHDDMGHGTHVSGIIGAQTDNVSGVAGVAPGALIMPVKACGSEGAFYESDLIDAINYAADNGAKVINMSLGGPSYGVLEQLAVYYAAGKGATLVAAVGNDGKQIVNYPAGYDDVIGVGALTNWWNPAKDSTSGIDPIGHWAWFSNYNNTVDFAAPGVNILSTMPTYPVNLNGRGYPQDYAFLTGTSMATPFVSGLAALIVARQPDANGVQVEKVIDAGTTDLGVKDGIPPLPGWDPWTGHGRINAYQSLMQLMLNTRLITAPTYPNGDNGWFTTTPTISLEIDATGTTSFYSWDDTSTPITYSLPFQPPSEAGRKLYYWSTLGAATEEARLRMIKFDAGAPVDPTSVTSSSHTTGTVSPDRSVDIAIAGATDPVSQVQGYSVSWTRDNTATPPGTIAESVTKTNFVSPTLSDGNWWFNIRTKDYAGNWSQSVHLGPFVIDGPPITGQVVVPVAPDGDNNWYRMAPYATLTPDQTAAVYYQFDSTSPAGWTGDLIPDPSVTVLVPDGQHILYFFSVDISGATETIENTPFIKADVTVPTGSISIDGGAVKTGAAFGTLSLSATDPVSGPAQMRFKNETGGWSAWEAYAPTKPWTLTAVDGTKTVSVQFKDAAGNESTITSDQISLRTDETAPIAIIKSPAISTNVSKKRYFPVVWSATDSSPSSGIAFYDVQYKIGPAGVWTNFKVNSTATSAKVAGLPGSTYYLRARGIDKAGNVGDWSGVVKTIVPFDQDSLVVKHTGFNSFISSTLSNFYRGTVRFSTVAGDKITYKIKGSSFALIAAKGPNRSKAEIRVDGVYVKTIDDYDSTIKYRRNVFSVSWSSIGTHTIEITNLGTTGRPLFDIDAIAVGR